MGLTVEETLRMGIESHQVGELKEAERLYAIVLNAHPKHPHANYNMAIVAVGVGKIIESLPFFKVALETMPSDTKLWLGYIDALVKVDRIADAKIALKQANNNEVEVGAYNNIGSVLMYRDDWKGAIACYKQALEVKPDDAEIYYNMGVGLNNSGDREAAINSYKQALKINPDYAEAYNNMGVVQSDQGDSEGAMYSYEHALKINPYLAGAKSNLLALLTWHNPKRNNPHIIVTVNEAMRAIDIQSVSCGQVMPDSKIVDLFTEATCLLSRYDLGLRTALSQTYRKSVIDLNCKRHMSIFKKHDVISEFCFGCYKVLVEPRSIIELIKLYVIFDNLELDSNNSRKCMIELRPKFSGFYKGYIFCAGLKEANQISERLNGILAQNIGFGLFSQVKRGCSEYPLSFPDYQAINNDGLQLMNYNQGWKVIERDHDRKTPILAKENKTPTLSGLNLNDVLIIQKWVSYARGIGDLSANLISQNPVHYQKIYDRAHARLDLFKYHH